MARPSLAGPWGSGAMALAAIGAAAAVISILQWARVKPCHVGDLVVSVFQHKTGSPMEIFARCKAGNHQRKTREAEAARFREACSGGGK